MSENLSGSAVVEIERIVKAADAAKVTIDGKEYATTSLHDPRKAENEPKCLGVNTLQGLADYVNSDIDTGYADVGDGEGAPRGLFLHVDDPESVYLRTGIFGEFNQRVALAKAKAVVPALGFGEFVDPELFLIRLVSLFAPTPGRDAVQSFVSQLTVQDVDTLKDTGTSQEVLVKRGIAGQLKATEKAPSQVELAPYRSFGEIVPPASMFLLRLRSNGAGRVPGVALFEADGGLWRIEAVRRIKEWLKGEVTGIPIFG